MREGTHLKHRNEHESVRYIRYKQARAHKARDSTPATFRGRPFLFYDVEPCARRRPWLTNPGHVGWKVSVTNPGHVGWKVSVRCDREVEGGWEGEEGGRE